MFVKYHDEVESIDSLRIRVPKILDDEELMNAAGCIGYAVKKYSGENATGEPYEVVRLAGNTFFNIDIYARVEDYELFMCDLENYLYLGTPVRETNRAGPNTRGTRLVVGTGVVCEVLVWVPDTTMKSMTIYVDGKLFGYQTVEVTHGNERAAVIKTLSDYIAHLKELG